MLANHISQQAAKIILSKMPEGATHFWTRFEVSPFEHNIIDPAKLKMDFFERWEKFPSDKFQEWDKYKESWEYQYARDGTNVDPNARIAIAEIIKISDENIDNNLDVESAINLLKSKGYVVAKIV